MENVEPNPIETFIQNQKSLLTLEKEAELEQHKKLLDTLSIGELERAGICLSKLVVDTVKNGLYGKTLYTMQASNFDKAAVASNESLKNKLSEKFGRHRFSPGDVVGLYEFYENKSPDFNSKPDLQGVVYRVKEFKVVVSVNEPPEDPYFEKKIFYMVLMTNEVTYNRYIKALDKLNKIKDAPDLHSQHLMRVLLKDEDPNSENPYIKRSDLENLTSKDVYFKDQSLNPEQKEAVIQALAAKSLFMIHGPPGTGKTKTVCEFINQCVQRKLKVLACAGSNIAVDNIVERLQAKSIRCCRLGHPARVLPTVLEATLDSLVSKDDSRKDLRNNQREINSLMKQLAKTHDKEARKTIRRTVAEREKEIRTLERGAVMDTLASCSVILCTNTGAGDRSLEDYIQQLTGKAFDVVVIDECAQALEVSCWIPLVYGKKVVLAGDHLQLPPTIKSKEANKKGLSVTLFDRMMKKYEESNSQLLRTQYRMNKMIMEWSSKEVYNGKLLADPSVAEHNLLDLRGKPEANADVPVLMLIDTAGCQMGEHVSQDEGQSKFNVGEADLVRVLIKEMKDEYQLQTSDIGIITPYNAQVDLIRQELQKDQTYKGIECSTVDGFQGREKEVIIISMVRSNPKGNIGFLGEFRRMNVAVTRAKRFVAIVCDTDTVKHDPFLKKLIEYFEANADIRTATEFQSDKSVRFGEGFIAKDQAPGKGTKEQGAAGGQEAKAAQGQKKKKNKNKKAAESVAQGEEKKEPETTQLQPVIPKNIVEGPSLKEVMQRIDNFINNANQKELGLPASLDGYQRKEVHSYAELKKLIHESVGDGDQRHIVLRKRAPVEEKKVDVVEESKTNVQKDVPKKPDVAAAQNAAKKKKEKEKEKAKAKKEEEMDDDAFLDSLIEGNKHCHYTLQSGAHCTNNINTLGVICKFCGYKFCTKHSLAENHGCGDAASIQAKAQFKDQFYRSIGRDIPKPLKKDEEDYLKKKLHERIQGQTQGRGVKPTKDKDKKTGKK